MRAMKGKLLKKLKTIKTIGYLKPERILHSNASDGYIQYTSPPHSNSQSHFHSPLTPIQVNENPKKNIQNNVHEQDPEIIDVCELMKDLDDQEMELDDEMDDKENIRPDLKVKKSEPLKENVENFSSLKSKVETFDEKVAPFSELDVLNFRRPDLDSGTLFDPKLLAAFEEAVMVVKAQEAERKAKNEEKIFKPLEEKELEEDEEENEPPLKTRKIEEIIDPLLEFEEKCPPGGCDSVILYTTGLRGIRKTFEECHSIRFLLENFRVIFFERDISMHSEFKEELWRILDGKVVPPRLFIKGRYIGGAEEVLTLHEQGKFRPLLEGIPIDQFQCPCEGCVGMRFIVCFKCNGSQKIVVEDGVEAMKCPECNENGLIVCPYCC
ncbi:uncharacterized protein At3g28850-like [Nicotiana tomentosiformis]|uniref:uncharacterized protein At3g28850-like n=1 Tax=Nicotiana tomentosiformis TaxID=4098 RepID=UPI00051C1F44|nr:uncharacterized protein At3g28850-like [Nicotiana tomentosiformis]